MRHLAHLIAGALVVAVAASGCGKSAGGGAVDAAATGAALPSGCANCTCLCQARFCSPQQGAQCSCDGTPPTSFACGLP